MIKRIKLEDIACFKKGSPQELSFNQEVGIIYGLNGTGKSTIARYLSDLSYPGFINCDINFTDGTNPDIYVYDKKFINRVFYETDKIKGIFTIGIIDTTSEKIIKYCTSRMNNIHSKIIEREHRIKEIKSYLEEEEKLLFTNAWNIVKGFKGSILDYCLERYKNDKAKFFNSLKNIAYEKETDYNFRELKEEIKEVEGENIKEKDKLDKLSYDLQTYDLDKIFEQKILASDSSYLSEIIKKIDASDWVLKRERDIRF